MRRRTWLRASLCILPVLLSGCYYYGSDTNSTTPSRPGQSTNYYIGQVGSSVQGPKDSTWEDSLTCGAGTLSDPTPPNFSTSDANAAGKMATFAYYTIAGPIIGKADGASSPYMWGFLQGMEAGWCYYNKLDQINGIDIFGDVETGNFGWYIHGGYRNPPDWVHENARVIQRLPRRSLREPRCISGPVRGAERVQCAHARVQLEEPQRRLPVICVVGHKSCQLRRADRIF